MTVGNKKLRLSFWANFSLAWLNAQQLDELAGEVVRQWWHNTGRYWLWLQLALSLGLLLALRFRWLEIANCESHAITLIPSIMPLLLAYKAASYAANTALNAQANGQHSSKRLQDGVYLFSIRAALPPIVWGALFMWMYYFIRFQQVYQIDCSLVMIKGLLSLWEGPLAAAVGSSCAIGITVVFMGVIRLAFAITTAHLFKCWQGVWRLLLIVTLVPWVIEAFCRTLFPVLAKIIPNLAHWTVRALPALKTANGMPSLIEMASMALLLLLLSAWYFRAKWLAYVGLVAALLMTAGNILMLPVPASLGIQQSLLLGTLLKLGAWFNNVGSIIATYWPLTHWSAQIPLTIFGLRISYFHNLPAVGVLYFTSANVIYVLLVLWWLGYLFHRETCRRNIAAGINYEPMLDAVQRDIAQAQPVAVAPVRQPRTRLALVRNVCGLPVPLTLLIAAAAFTLGCFGPAPWSTVIKPLKYKAQYGHDLRSGRAVSLEDYRGKWVLLDVWASW